ncbi:hypothetical protein SCHPADRAFT_74212 [Schizopora paradoxa]|uniref:Uncharacterized protein n=1 Tax=Schizopora paradoxa TaxID=27342 RepID=A0A0H2SQJ7_9AGAM|nr:hypothetical protein SCHPADRAFT_74212 [Schizopora paradoxa]
MHYTKPITRATTIAACCAGRFPRPSRAALLQLLLQSSRNACTSTAFSTSALRSIVIAPCDTGAAGSFLIKLPLHMAINVESTRLIHTPRNMDAHCDPLLTPVKFRRDDQEGGPEAGI